MSRSMESGAEGEETLFLIRWRGQKEGPYSLAVIQKKLALNELGLLHEILHEGRWLTIRDYLTEREAVSLIADRAQKELEASQKAEREHAAQMQQATLAEEQRRTDLLAAKLVQQSIAPASASLRSAARPHRGGMILALGLVGLFICGPLCLVAWVMGSSDLKEMDAGLMDDSGRATTNSGKNMGVMGTILWIIGSALLYVLGKL